ncbi:membrane protein [Mycobacterium phage Yecey3]|uniref:Membrane protein n=1 Tax=Mycobacterium phage Yecey3 TaxID=2656617 RepID=A0A649V920_9CAUD|nr:membrane protein [Mycobacterium phage Yecey3]QGJ88816.1 membrane protein [Mycobacterium phage Yecey3]
MPPSPIWAIDLHIIALGLLAYFCLVMDARSKRNHDKTNEPEVDQDESLR